MPTFGCTGGGGQTYATEVRVCQGSSGPLALPVASYYDGQGGGNINNVPPVGTPATATDTATNGLQLPLTGFPNSNRADNYSARLRGFIRPTTSGNYTFYITSDDAGQFSIGAAGAAIGATTPLITNNGYSGPPGVGGVTSVQVALVAGQFYPFEMIFSEGGGGDYVQVDWSGPVGARQVVPASVLSSTNQAGIRAVYRTTTVTAGVSTITYALLDGTPVVPTLANPIVDCP